MELNSLWEQGEREKETINLINKYKYTVCEKVMSIMGEKKDTEWAESRMLMGKGV